MPIDVPGETKNPPQIADFVASQVFSTLEYLTPNCSKYKVLDTKFNGYTSTKNYGAWKETWTIDACGERFSAPIDLYRVDDNPYNTTVGIRPGLVKRLN